MRVSLDKLINDIPIHRQDLITAAQAYRASLIENIDSTRSPYGMRLSSVLNKLNWALCPGLATYVMAENLRHLVASSTDHRFVADTEDIFLAALGGYREAMGLYEVLTGTVKEFI